MIMQSEQEHKKNTQRNIIRYSILHKGYATISDVRNFIPCGYEKALFILSKEMSDAQKEGKTTLNGISSKRLLKYVDLTDDEIRKYAEEEKKELSSKNFQKE